MPLPAPAHRPDRRQGLIRPDRPRLGRFGAFQGAGFGVGMFRNQLAWRLVVVSLLIGSVLSVFSTAIQIVSSFERQKNDAINALEQVDRALSQPLAFALWTFDYDQINIILDGLVTNESVTFVALTSQTGTQWERGTSTDSPILDRVVLEHQSDTGEMQVMGTLEIEISLESINARIWEQLWVTLLSNLAKANLAALVLLYAVHRLIIRHLRSIAHHVAGSDPDRRIADLRLDRTPREAPDDIDQIVLAFKSFEQRANTALARANTEIRERAKSERAAREALSVRTSFIGTISHEVRTPLNAILGFLHLLEKTDDMAERQRQYVHCAAMAAQQLLKQLTNVLELSRLDSNAVTIAKRPTDLRALAKDWHESALASVRFYKKTLAVTLDVDPHLRGAYLLDGPHLTQIVENLIDNAAKFTGAGKIRIALHQPAPDRIEIRICDTGIGIPIKAQARIFDRFTQSEDGIERAHGGAGLGLTISKEIARLMGATLTLSAPETHDYLTCFLITLNDVERPEADHG